MATMADQHIKKLLKLPIYELARAAQALLESLDEGTPDPPDEAADIEEWMRRLKSIEDGTAVLVDAEEAIKRVRASLRRRRKNKES